MKRETLIWLILFVAGGLFLVYRASTSGMGSAFVKQTPSGTWIGASPAEAAAGVAEFSLARTTGTWVAALMTLFVFSFLYRDNPLYKIAESTVVGVSAAYWMVIGFWSTLIPNLFGVLFPAWIQSWAQPGLSPLHVDYWQMSFIPLILGAMLLWRLMPTGGWVSRWPLAFIIGATAGIRLIGFLQADFISQINNSILPLIVMDAEGRFQPWESIRHLLIVSSILACLVYFFFSFEHKGVVGQVSRVGIWVLMITFGAAFGYTVMGRIALLAIRFEFLFDDWLWLIDPTNQRLGYD
jgi:hypothetical protein